MPFGRAMLDHWPLDPAVTYLNHGTVGVVPKRVLAAQQTIRDTMERQPSRFVLRELSGLVGSKRATPTLLRIAAGEVALFLGARGDDLAFVDNATTGANAVLRSMDLTPGDEILVLDHSYGAVALAATYVARRSGAVVRPVVVPYPVFDRAGLLERIEAALGPRTRLAIIDHVTSESALILPVADIARLCRSRGVPVLVDGAHAPGMLPVDLPALGVDYYTANLHKWACAPRSSGILWVAPERQASIHPVVISWGLDRGFLAEFDWVGTRDPSPFLAAPEGIAFLRDLGVDAARNYRHDLAWKAAQFLAGRWGTTLGFDEHSVGAMATLPLPERFGSAPADATRLRDALLFEDQIEVQVHSGHGRVWIRVSAQVYNEWSEIEKLAGAVERR